MSCMSGGKAAIKKLPIGIQSFRDIREGGYLYVDKTRWVYTLITGGKWYFLARPRRFGKSLLVSVLEQVFLGNKALFRGLWLGTSDWSWHPHPVIRIDLSMQHAERPEQLTQFLWDELDTIAERYGIRLRRGTYYERFAELIRKLAHRKGKVVVLIDEYDKPILDNLESPEVAIAMREVLKGFYSVLKGLDECLAFVLLTGVSRFSKAGVFSGLNQLNDISMDRRYAELLGLTEAELERECRVYIEALSAELGVSYEEGLAAIRHWYDGYCFAPGCQRVYNPFSVFLAFDRGMLGNYWFESGASSFLVQLMKQTGFDVSCLDRCEVGIDEISEYDLELLDVLPLLFQSGYLTIKGYEGRYRLLRLGYPNYEVAHSFIRYLFRMYSGYGVRDGLVRELLVALRALDFSRFFELLDRFLMGIPYDVVVESERYYQSVLYLLFRVLGFQVGVEVRMATGRIDLVVEDGVVLIFELKIRGSARDAVRQIKARGYSVPYLSLGKRVYIVGLRIGGRRVVEWHVEEFSAGA